MLNMRQILPLLIFCCCNIGCPVAQELNAAVTVNSSRIGGDRQLFDRLEQQLGASSMNGNDGGAGCCG